MNAKEFLFRSTKWSNAELGLIKACVTCSGIALGIYFYEFLKPFESYFIGLFFVLAIWTGVLWLRKLRTK